MKNISFAKDSITQFNHIPDAVKVQFKTYTATGKKDLLISMLTKAVRPPEYLNKQQYCEAELKAINIIVHAQGDLNVAYHNLKSSGIPTCNEEHIKELLSLFINRNAGWFHKNITRSAVVYLEGLLKILNVSNTTQLNEQLKDAKHIQKNLDLIRAEGGHYVPGIVVDYVNSQAQECVCFRSGNICIKKYHPLSMKHDPYKISSPNEKSLENLFNGLSLEQILTKFKTQSLDSNFRKFILDKIYEGHIPLKDIGSAYLDLVLRGFRETDKPIFPFIKRNIEYFKQFFKVDSIWNGPDDIFKLISGESLSNGNTDDNLLEELVYANYPYQLIKELLSVPTVCPLQLNLSEFDVDEEQQQKIKSIVSRYLAGKIELIESPPSSNIVGDIGRILPHGPEGAELTMNLLACLCNITCV